jgi:hypothetical protein
MENKEPSRDEVSEQEARSIEYKEEAEQLLKRHQHNKILSFNTKRVRGILAVYLLFVYTLTCVGTLASSRHHDTSSEILYVVSVLLILVIPIGGFGYFLRIRFRKKPTTEGAEATKQSLVVRITQSSIGGFLARLGNRPAVRLLAFALPVSMIADAVIRFPSHPRSSLVSLAFSTAYFSFLVAHEIVRSFDKALQTQISEIWGFNRSVKNILVNMGEMIQAISDRQDLRHEGLTKRHDALMEAHIRNSEATLAAIQATNHAMLVIANIEEPDPPSKKAVENEEPPT